MPIGGANPCPFRPGGPQTPTQKVYLQLKRAVGEGGSADREDGIDGLWRLSRARGLAAIEQTEIRAPLQAWPQLATDGIAYYERALALSGAGLPDTARRAQILPPWVTRQDIDLPNLEAELQRIDERFSLQHVDYDLQATTVFGRTFASQDGVELPIFGGEGYSRVPNYSTDFCVRVLFTPGYSGLLTERDQGLVDQARARLMELMPSWVDFTIATGLWVLGTTPIGQGHI